MLYMHTRVMSWRTSSWFWFTPDGSKILLIPLMPGRSHPPMQPRLKCSKCSTKRHSIASTIAHLHGRLDPGNYRASNPKLKLHRHRPRICERSNNSYVPRQVAMESLGFSSPGSKNSARIHSYGNMFQFTTGAIRSISRKSQNS